MHALKFELPDPLSMGRVRWAFRCSEEAKKKLFGAAERELGVKGPELVQVCILPGLSEQPPVHQDAKKCMIETFVQFQEEYAERARDLRALMRAYRETN